MVKWNEVTWYSKLLAAILFIGAIPTLCFYIGMQYQLASQIVIIPTEVVPSLKEDICPGYDQASLNKCAGDRLRVQEKMMDDVYKKALDHAADFDKVVEVYNLGMSQVQAVQDSQNAWILYRDKQCIAEANLWSGGSGHPEILYGCQASAAKQRIEELNDFGQL